MLRRIASLAAYVAVAAVVLYQFVYKPSRQRWQADPDEAARLLPGDQLVPDPEFKQTMALTIDAPPSAVWPWIVQMGYRRSGWYSYDAIDMRGQSAREIRPELQGVAVGQIIEAGPGIGFRVEIVEPEHALVLYGDNELFTSAQPELSTDKPDAGLKLVGLLGDANMSAFQVSWAFILEPLDGGRTRLLERFRTRTTPGPAAAIVTPLIDVGHFFMTRKHMLGLKERAEVIVDILNPSGRPEIQPAVHHRPGAAA